jgi:hypothetical protein
MFAWIGPAVAAMIAAEVFARVPWWCYLINVAQVIHVAAEMITQQGLDSATRRPWRIARWLNNISMDSWDKGFRLTVPGVMAQVAMFGTVIGILAFGFPAHAPPPLTLVTWAAACTYCCLTLRLFVHEPTVNEHGRSLRVYFWVRRLVGLQIALWFGAALAIAHFVRGLGTASGPASATDTTLMVALALICAAPLAMGFEGGVMHRTLISANNEHIERLAVALRRQASLASQITSRLDGEAQALLISQMSDAVKPADAANLAEAVASLRNASDLVQAIHKLTPSAAIPPERMARLLRVILTEWPGTSTVTVEGDDIGLWQGELAMRTTRLLISALAARNPAPEDALDVSLTAGADIVLTYGLHVDIAPEPLDTFACHLDRSATETGAQVVWEQGETITLRLTWPGSGEAANA